MILTPELNLCAPAGMPEHDREAWLIAAAQKIQQWAIPESILRQALSEIVVDHPAKLLPAIKSWLGGWVNPVSCETIMIEGPSADELLRRFLDALESPQSSEWINRHPDQWKRIAVERGYLRWIGGNFRQRVS
jgi:hypothetical protein